MPTSELYAEADNPNSTLGQPPAAPAPVPPPTSPAPQVIQVRTHRMADERPDGSIRDTSTEALRDGNDLGFRKVDDPVPAPPPVVEPPKEVAPEPPKEAVPPPPPAEKVYAGKFKSPDELEKSYLEAQKKLTQLAQEKSELEKKVAAPPPPPPVPKTPEQLAQEKAEADRILNDFVANPKKFREDLRNEAIQQTQVALNAQQMVHQWRKDNPDIAEHEVRVAFEATLLAQSDPELARNPEALFAKATDNFRQFTGKLRTEGAKEALTQETRTIPLLTGTAQPQATEQPAKAPLTADEAYAAHMRMLKEQEQRSHRGLRR